jgi:hypothetical protein
MAMVTVTDLPVRVWHHVTALELDDQSEDALCDGLWNIWRAYELFKESYPEDATRLQRIIMLLLEIEQVTNDTSRNIS